MNKFLKLAEAFAKEHEYNAYLDYRLCAIIVKGGKVISVGFNHHGCTGLTRRYRNKEHVISTHAEVEAVQIARKKTRLEGSKIYVVRIRKDGTFGNAQPCDMCMSILWNYGVSKCIYTIDNNSEGRMKVYNPFQKE